MMAGGQLLVSSGCSDSMLWGVVRLVIFGCFPLLHSLGSTIAMVAKATGPLYPTLPKVRVITVIIYLRQYNVYSFHVRSRFKACTVTSTS